MRYNSLPDELDFLVDFPVPPDEKIASNCETILGLQELAKEAGSFACLLSGGYDVVSAPPEGQGRIDTAAVLQDMGIYEPYYIKRKDRHRLRSMAGYSRVVRGHKQRRDYDPFDKFYLSLDLTSAEQIELGTQLFADVVRQAQEQDALLATKEFTHAYDALLLYTHRSNSPVIAGILQSLYPRYQNTGLFYDTQHFFQAEITGIPPEHIGFVHEPSVSRTIGKTLGSHSVRMGKLGRHIDSLEQPLGATLNTHELEIAAASALVDPAYPYMVAME